MTNSTAKAPPPEGAKRRRYRAITIVALVVLALIATAATLAFKWPFTEAKVVGRLESATSTNVRVGRFRTTYFPPGCVIEGAELRSRNGSSPAPLMTVGRLTILSNYRQLLFRQRIEVMHLEAAHLDMAQARRLRSQSNEGGGKTAFNNSSSSNSMSIAKIVVNRGVIEYPRKERPAVIFNVHQLTLNNVIQGKGVAFHVSIDNPLPPGRVQADGQFDPWNVSDISQTPLSGVYHFIDARLSSLGGIADTLTSQGSFAGPAIAVRVQGSTDTANFEVKSASHPLHLRTDFRAVVNSTNGDVVLQSIQGRFEKTSFGAAGDVAGKKNAHSKVTSLCKPTIQVGELRIGSACSPPIQFQR